MPRKNPITDEEKAVCARFREARKSAGFSSAELARRVGVDGARIRNYEAGSNPFPFWIGQLIAEETAFCQRWLATGRLPQGRAIPLDVWLYDFIPNTLTFTEGYRLLEPDINKEIAELAARKGIPEEQLSELDFQFLKVGSHDEEWERRTGLDMSRFYEFIDGLPIELARRFYSECEALSHHYLSAHGKEIEQFRKDYPNLVVDQFEEVERAMKERLEAVLKHRKAASRRINLENQYGLRNDSDMPADLLQSLIERARCLTSGRGEQASLARALDIPPARVSEWFSGAGAPTAAKTLELLAWVEAAERKQKSPARAVTQAGQKTRQKPHENAKKPSSPRIKK